MERCDITCRPFLGILSQSSWGQLDMMHVGFEPEKNFKGKLSEDFNLNKNTIYKDLNPPNLKLKRQMTK